LAAEFTEDTEKIQIFKSFPLCSLWQITALHF